VSGVPGLQVLGLLRSPSGINPLATGLDVFSRFGVCLEVQPFRGEGMG
jgi:hypothetical protein